MNRVSYTFWICCPSRSAARALLSALCSMRIPRAAADPPESISFLGVYKSPVDLSISATLALAGEDAKRAAAADVVVMADIAALLDESCPEDVLEFSIVAFVSDFEVEDSACARNDPSLQDGLSSVPAFLVASKANGDLPKWEGGNFESRCSRENGSMDDIVLGIRIRPPPACICDCNT